MRKFRSEWSHGDRERHQRRNDFSEEPHTSYSWRENKGREDLVTPPLQEKGNSDSPMAMAVEFKTYVDQACRAAEEFVNIYYETMDKRRRVSVTDYYSLLNTSSFFFEPAINQNCISDSYVL